MSRNGYFSPNLPHMEYFGSFSALKCSLHIFAVSLYLLSTIICHEQEKSKNPKKIDNKIVDNKWEKSPNFSSFTVKSEYSASEEFASTLRYYFQRSFSTGVGIKYKC